MRHSSMRKLYGSLFVVCIAVITARLTLASAYRNAAHEVCDLVESNYYRRDEPKVVEFIKKCRTAAATQSFLLSKRANIERLNGWLGTLGVSHLSLYPPQENRSLWQNRALDTGLRARIVESDMAIVRVVKDSAADFAGIRRGDVLDAINGEIVSSVLDAQTGRGRFDFTRRGKRYSVTLEPTEITVDLRPVLTSLDGGVAVLRIASFLPQYFDASHWKPIAVQLVRYSHLIIDLRDNAGGSFPAMLRALSPFRCRDPEVGALVGTGRGDDVEMRDELDTRSQLAQLSEARRLLLNTFDDYGCYDGDVTVLIDDGTSSTAEIFAEAFYTRRFSRVWGQPSAGQVVMAQWFDVHGFGDETALAIPIAGYISSDGRTIENAGLVPEKQLYYDLGDARLGIDTWIREASQSETP